MSGKKATERRVYNLPQATHRRLRVFMVSSGITNETEAVLHLLRGALALRDTADDIVKEANLSLSQGQARSDVLKVICEHALIRTMQKDTDQRPPRWWRFTLASGEAIRFENGVVSHEVVT